MLDTLATAWHGYRWCGVDAWAAPTPCQFGGFAERYPGLALETVAISEHTTPLGRSFRFDWAVLDASSSGLRRFVDHVRESRGKGACLLLVPPGPDERAWYSSTLAATCRLLLSFEGTQDRAASAAHEGLLLTFVATATAAGCAVLIPLDLHPWAGYAVVGRDDLLTRLHDLLPDDLPGVDAAVPADVVARGTTTSVRARGCAACRRRTEGTSPWSRVLVVGRRPGRKHAERPGRPLTALRTAGAPPTYCPDGAAVGGAVISTTSP